MFKGKNKAVTFSYDDGVLQDIRLIEIFNKYNLKATFNLNSELLGTPNTLEREGRIILHDKVSPEDVRHIYDGHEIAVHTLTHPRLYDLPDDELVRQTEEDRLKLSQLAGYEIFGMAYPFGDNDDRIEQVLRTRTKIKYARVVETTKNFDIDSNLMRYRGTIYHHAEWNDLFDTGRKFLELETDKPQLLYIWGHAYEFDIYPERWEQFEEFCRMISGQKDIFYGTNSEVLLGTEEAHD